MTIRAHAGFLERRRSRAEIATEELCNEGYKDTSDHRPPVTRLFAPWTSHGDAWLRRIKAQSEAASIEVIAVLPSRLQGTWLNGLANAAICFVDPHVALNRRAAQRPLLAAYWGERHHAFCLVFTQLGPVYQPFFLDSD